MEVLEFLDDSGNIIVQRIPEMDLPRLNGGHSLLSEKIKMLFSFETEKHLMYLVQEDIF